MSVAVTVLGSSGTHPSPGRVCSGYLVESEGFRLLLDAGNGSLSNLPCDVAELDAVIVSHLHADHCVDLFGLNYALRFHPAGPRSVPVYAPAGAHAHLEQLLPSGDSGLGDHLGFASATAGDTLELGPMRVRLHAMNHPIETIASRIEVADRVVAFSGDTAATDALVDCGREADLLICEASWATADGPFPPGIHLTGTEAGQHADEAAAARLLITHVFPSYRPEEIAAEAARAYSGEVRVANDREEHVL
ncbi:MBL fold metallo-hydrolase [Egibacter rhizosphaerae]|uniref:MBL fold metallo-hydrolase n=1 Tax=Egibacter rhizosphaerae TaxID=1670831 RepID=UPI0013F14339|nr:MBL fold metallo-hydrolase [Egibacter rhizosphaerae]